MEKPNYTLTQDSITVVHEGKPYTVTKGQANFEKLKAALEEGRWDDVPEHLTVRSTTKNWSKGKFTLAEGGSGYMYDGKHIPVDLNSKITKLVAANAPADAFFNFYARLLKNPSWRSVQQLFRFLDKEGIPLTKDGCFLAYKSVKRDYRDHHSGTFVNSPGSTHSMPRNEISDDPREACHVGFHVGALKYAQGFGSGDRRIVICKVAPEDVVCVPYDSSHEKMRVCKYRVVGEHGDKLPDTVLEDDMLPEVEEHEGVTVSGDDKERSEKASAVTKRVRGAVPKKYEAIHACKSFEEYMKFTVPEVREYASKFLKIVGVSKLPGGKKALVAKIIATRTGG